MLPYLIFAVGGYALGMPRAAQVQLALAAVFYPLETAATLDALAARFRVAAAE